MLSRLRGKDQYKLPVLKKFFRNLSLSETNPFSVERFKQGEIDNSNETQHSALTRNCESRDGSIESHFQSGNGFQTG